MFSTWPYMIVIFWIAWRGYALKLENNCMYMALAGNWQMFAWRGVTWHCQQGCQSSDVWLNRTNRRPNNYNLFSGGFDRTGRKCHANLYFTWTISKILQLSKLFAVKKTWIHHHGSNFFYFSLFLSSTFMQRLNLQDFTGN